MKKFCRSRCDFLGVKPAPVSELLAQYQTILEKQESLLFDFHGGWIDLGRKLASLLPVTTESFAPNTPVAIGQEVISYAMSANCH